MWVLAGPLVASAEQRGVLAADGDESTDQACDGLVDGDALEIRVGYARREFLDAGPARP
jgi:hypothetical protein